jgi:hypothetical protein
MKPLLLLTLSLLLIVSCRKGINSEPSSSTYLKNVKASLNDSLSKADFSALDFSKAIITNAGNAVNYLRIPFKGIKISEEFVLLKTNSNGDIIKGLIINLKKDGSEGNKRYAYNGHIDIFSFNWGQLISSEIVNGFITAFHNERSRFRSFPVSDTIDVLPEVVVTTYLRTGGGVSYSDWMNIPSMFGGGNSGFYSLIAGDPGGGQGGSGGGHNNDTILYNRDNENNSPDPSISRDQMILIDFEPDANVSPINIQDYLRCFSKVPDNGATCSIELLTDIPVDSDPNKLFNWSIGSPGHAFLQIKKINGNQSVMQNIGFHPAQRWKTILTNAPIAGRFLDNGKHEYNASIKMDLTPDKLRKTLDHILELSIDLKYDIDEFNCTDFALDIFNFTRSNPIEIPKYNIPGGMTQNGSSTPQGLYIQLKNMKRMGIESSNIMIPGLKGWVADSDGPCN